MNDLISRRAVLDYIDNMPSELTADGRRMIRRIRLTEYIQDSLPSAEPGWIPVTERLPEEPFGCIVSYHGFMLTPHGEREYDAIYPETLGYDGSGWNNSEGECVDNMIDVTAWMPLPECYRGEKDGE